MQKEGAVQAAQVDDAAPRFLSVRRHFVLNISARVVPFYKQPCRQPRVNSDVSNSIWANPILTHLVGVDPGTSDNHPGFQI